MLYRSSHSRKKERQNQARKFQDLLLLLLHCSDHAFRAQIIHVYPRKHAQSPWRWHFLFFHEFQWWSLQRSRLCLLFGRSIWEKDDRKDSCMVHISSHWKNRSVKHQHKAREQNEKKTWTRSSGREPWWSLCEPRSLRHIVSCWESTWGTVALSQIDQIHHTNSKSKASDRQSKIHHTNSMGKILRSIFTTPTEVCSIMSPQFICECVCVFAHTCTSYSTPWCLTPSKPCLKCGAWAQLRAPSWIMKIGQLGAKLWAKMCLGYFLQICSSPSILSLCDSVNLSLIHPWLCGWGSLTNANLNHCR